MNKQSRTQIISTSKDKEHIYQPIDTINILGVAASMRQGSFSTQALQKVLKTASVKHGANTRLLDLHQTHLPLYDPNNELVEERGVLRDSAAAVKWADAYILASPDYHGSMSGVMKNFMDYFWREFSGKTFG